MALYEIVDKVFQIIPATTFAAEGLQERHDIQGWIRTNIESLDDNLLVIGEEFSNWEDSLRRIDLLALDRDGNLVVIEIKRTEDGGHMELQSIRYAAMISAMRYEDVVETFENYMQSNQPDAAGQADSKIRKFLDSPDGEEVVISTVPRIILVSAKFSREITTTVLWLIERGVNIRCVQLQPYKLGDKVLVDMRQVIPLAQAGDYQVRLRAKDEIARQSSGTYKRREETLSILLRHGVIKTDTVIEIIPQIRPDGTLAVDAKTFQARIDASGPRAALIWLHDGTTHSFTKLFCKLEEEYGVKRLRNNIAIHWRVVDESETLWDIAERLAG